ncbi:hypothetical protein [Methyloraptor flagellatus]|uniref:Glycine zipper domain-containing protein n=1 Tax=Methyloraptor flagellatus TaxID=3162530 RepID=A0AAU7X776_9HYPH
MNKTFAALMTGAVLVSSLAVTSTAEAQYWRHHGYHGGYRHHGGAGVGAGVAAGLIGGALIGGAIASQQNRTYYYDDGYVDAPAGATVYEEAPVVRRRVVREVPGSNCTEYTKYDMYGKPYLWKDCN